MSYHSNIHSGKWSFGQQDGVFQMLFLGKVIGSICAKILGQQGENGRQMESLNLTETAATRHLKLYKGGLYLALNFSAARI